MGLNIEAEPKTNADAPGGPGIPPTWCSSAKEIVGCSLGPSRLWFTIGGGIVNEVFYPRVDIPQIRDLGFIVADDQGFWVEVKRMDSHKLVWAAQGVPALEIVHQHARFTLRLRIAPDHHRDVLLVDIKLEGEPGLRPYALLAPHLGSSGHDNQAEVCSYRNRRMLWAEQGPFGLALAAVDNRQQDAWGRASAGYVGASDSWQDFSQHGRMEWQYSRAGPGNVSLTGELPRHATLALGFASSKESAATLAISALMQPFNEPWQRLLDAWSDWHRCCVEQHEFQNDIPDALREQYFTSAMVLRVHQDKIYPGAMVASLSIPWGNTRDERGGYHLVWPRDLVESAGALLALGAEDEARDILRYLIATQHADGHWYQNQWLGGKAYWQGVQLDEVAFPVLLAARLAERNALQGIEVADMIRRAVGFIARTGPISQQDRWEEDTGINTFTLSVCIAALVAGAAWLEDGTREFVLDLADYWNAHIEDWTVVYDTELARRLGVHGYYIRNAPSERDINPRALLDVLPIKNRADAPVLTAAEQVGIDFLQLVRFGLRRADDPLILDSIRVVDELLKVDTPNGPSWHRYNGDGYGEHDDGTPFDGAGQGRVWPLLTGERGHYELAAGKDPLPYLQAMVAMSGTGGMIPEQVWDSAPIPAKGLFPGCPSGSAMPLVWAHAEYIKLLFSRQLGRPCDQPAATSQRYKGERPIIKHAIWLPQDQIPKIGGGQTLFIALYEPGVIHWSSDGWQSAWDSATRDTGLGLHLVELDTQALRSGQIDFTTRRAATGEWLGRNYTIEITNS
ncbi:MAG: glycosyl hydrolase [Gammaproteobacteria bacterium]|nr:glycosyl hydrolase [Gammaproteobacteria bacterium]MBU1483108.1 glycosyl hydrolase [Gammaproteobacteria bacterium]